MKGTTAIALAAVTFCMGMYVAGEVTSEKPHQPVAQRQPEPEVKTVIKTRVEYKTKIKTKTVVDPACKELRELAFEMMASAEEIYGIGHSQEKILSDARKAVHSGEPFALADVQRAQNELTGTALIHFTDLMDRYHSIESMKGCKK